MKVLLVMLVLLMLLPLDAISAGTIWGGKKTVVRDHLPDEWQADAKQIVADFNAILPKRAPRLVYRDKEPRLCRNVRFKHGIGLCLRPGIPGGMTVASRRGHRFLWAEVGVDTFAAYEPGHAIGILCEEMLAATVGMPDVEFSERPDSCQGVLDHPGPYDERFVKKVYRAHGSGPRRSAGGKHR